MSDNVELIGNSYRESAERTVKSIAAMLGWINVPPRETLEADIRALKARAVDASSLCRLAKEAVNGWACYARTNREHDEIARLHKAIDAIAGERS